MRVDLQVTSDSRRVGRIISFQMAEVAALPTAVLDAMGQPGRAYGLKHFLKSEGVKRLAAVILSAKSLLTTRLAAR